jgi:hypothetical protein
MIDLTLFCDEDGWLSKPWKSGEYVYATDGRICCQVSAAEYDAEPWEHKQRKAPSIADVLTEPDAWTQFEFKPVECEKCKGKYEYSGRCSYCYGSGQHECDCGDAHDCGYCDGTGKETHPCLHKRRLFGVLFNDKYLARMAAAGVTEIGLVGDGCLQFRGPGFRGALMGIHEGD